jgi:hypothetical protein
MVQEGDDSLLQDKLLVALSSARHSKNQIGLDRGNKRAMNWQSWSSDGRGWRRGEDDYWSQVVSNGSGGFARQGPGAMTSKQACRAFNMRLCPFDSRLHDGGLVPTGSTFERLSMAKEYLFLVNAVLRIVAKIIWVGMYHTHQPLVPEPFRYHSIN